MKLSEINKCAIGRLQQLSALLQLLIADTQKVT